MKKYLYYFIIIISIIIMVVLGTIFKNKQLSIATNNESNILDTNLLESENIIETEEQEEIQQNEEIREEQNNQEENKQQETITESTNNKEITTKNKAKETQTNPTTSINTSNLQSNINQAKQEEQKPINNKQETTTQVQTQSTKVQTKEEGEKFIRNDTMINKIKNVIDNNKSDNMKTYGYTIQVDSSIKSKTNQFTFAESRVINLIKYSFGTIRIYAEDYYNNGQFIMTECYIF